LDHVSFNGNGAIGGPGGPGDANTPGGDGGRADGGAIVIASAVIRLNSVDFLTNSATGGPAGDGVTGGDGGNARGGGLFSTASDGTPNRLPTVVADRVTATNNTAGGGSGGAGANSRTGGDGGDGDGGFAYHYLGNGIYEIVAVNGNSAVAGQAAGDGEDGNGFGGGIYGRRDALVDLGKDANVSGNSASTDGLDLFWESPTHSDPVPDVSGTPGPDIIIVTGGPPGSDTIVITVNDVPTTLSGIEPTRPVIIAGGGGDDFISARGNFGLDFTIFGDDGNDTLEGSNGNDLLLGGNGNDTMDGGLGRDVLFGGWGEDRLNGRGDSDILVADASHLDDFSPADVRALNAIRAAWVSGNSYAQQVAHINLLGALHPWTMRADGTSDRVLGEMGLDLYYAEDLDVLPDFDSLTEILNEVPL
jgi:hypothetical protein